MKRLIFIITLSIANHTLIGSPYSIVFKANGTTSKPTPTKPNQKTKTEISNHGIQLGINFLTSNLDQELNQSVTQEVEEINNHQNNEEKKEEKKEQKNYEQTKNDMIKKNDTTINQETNTTTIPENRTTKFVYSLKSDLYYSISDSNVQLIPTNSFFTGLMYKSTSMLSIGYTPVNLNQNQTSFSDLLRHSEFPGLHLHIGNHKIGWLRISPLLLIDSPGRLISNQNSLNLNWKERFFYQSVQESLSFRQTEGSLLSNQFKDRIAHQLKYELIFDWLAFGIGYRTSNFSRTATTPALSIDHSEVSLGLLTKVVSFSFGATRSFGEVFQTNNKKIQLDANEYRSNILVNFGHFEINLFSSRSEGDQRSYLQQLEKIGFIDYGASIVDLPILGSYSTMLHSVPCTEELCSDVFRSNSSQLFRYTADYAELTLSYLFSWIGFGLRGGIILPHRYEQYDNFGQKTKEIYTDLTEVSFEIQAYPTELQKGLCSIIYSRLYRRNNTNHQRELESQSLSFRIKVNIN